MSLPVPERLRQRLWAELTCGRCGHQFIAEPATVPCFTPDGRPRMPCCRGCWDERAALRKRLGLPEQGRPSCYPSDYEET